MRGNISRTSFSLTVTSAGGGDKRKGLAVTGSDACKNKSSRGRRKRAEIKKKVKQTIYSGAST